jgi:hypothetical protein
VKLDGGEEFSLKLLEAPPEEANLGGGVGRAITDGTIGPK